MQEQKHSTQFLRKRKFLVVLPVLVIPFVTLGFWGLGGGKGNGAQAAQGYNLTGLNLELPGANFKDDKVIDKLGYYEKAASDSAKLLDLMKNDPYFNKQEIDEDTLPEEVIERVTPAPNKSYSAKQRLKTSPYSVSKYTDPNEQKVYQKLAQLNSAIKEASNGTAIKEESYLSHSNQPALPTDNIDRLEQMMQTMNSGGSEDAEMNQINGMLEKIIDIQHPERMKDKLKEKSIQHKEEVLAVSTDVSKTTISLLDSSRQKTKQLTTNGFYGLDDDLIEDVAQNAIEAVVHENQTLINGAVVKMRLLKDVYINGHLIAKGNFAYGTASLNNERLEISINSIRDGHSLFAVKLEVYDMDGLAGIYIPGAITRDVAKQSTDNALQSVALNSLNPSVGAQAATAGIETAKNLLSKKVKLIKVQVKAGYKILLKDKNQKQ